MKKTLLPIFASALFASVAFSKVSAGELRYFGSVNLQHLNPSTQTKTDFSNYAITSTSFAKNFGLGLAGGAQYDINNSFYVNAEAFANYANTGVKNYSDEEEIISKQNFTYGLLSRLGYNINESTSAYIGAGFNYGKHSVSYYDALNLEWSHNNKNLLSGIATLGLATNVTDSAQLYTEYQISKAKSYNAMDSKINYSNRSFVIGVRKFFN